LTATISEPNRLAHPANTTAYTPQNSVNHREAQR